MSRQNSLYEAFLVGYQKLKAGLLIICYFCASIDILQVYLKIFTFDIIFFDSAIKLDKHKFLSKPHVNQDRVLYS